MIKSYQFQILGILVLVLIQLVVFFAHLKKYVRQIGSSSQVKMKPPPRTSDTRDGWVSRTLRENDFPSERWPFAPKKSRSRTENSKWSGFFVVHSGETCPLYLEMYRTWRWYPKCPYIPHSLVTLLNGEHIFFPGQTICSNPGGNGMECPESRWWGWLLRCPVGSEDQRLGSVGYNPSILTVYK